MKKANKGVGLVVLLTMFLSLSACGKSNGTSTTNSSTTTSTFESSSDLQSDQDTSDASLPEPNEAKIQIAAGDTVVYGTLYDNEVAHSYAEMLPLSVDAFDRISLVKSTRLPDYLSGNGQLTRSYTKGLIFYWPDGPEVAFLL